jgi:hypothetical protein
MVQICEKCGIQISEDEGNIEEHNILGHEQFIFKPIDNNSLIIQNSLESDLYDSMP